jgi:predicted nucleic acid-binding protein
MPVADTLLRLAEEPAFYLPRWSEDILQELERTLRKWDYSEAQIARRVTVMRDCFPEALVTGHEGLADSLEVDEKDRHVLACAVRAGAHAIVSDNLKHFPSQTMERLGIECLTAGEFLKQQYHLNPDLFIQILESQHIDAKMSMSQLLESLPAELEKLIHF